jgi:hypothetical protein
MRVKIKIKNKLKGDKKNLIWELNSKRIKTLKIL